MIHAGANTIRPEAQKASHFTFCAKAKPDQMHTCCLRMNAWGTFEYWALLGLILFPEVVEESAPAGCPCPPRGRAWPRWPPGPVGAHWFDGAPHPVAPPGGRLGGGGCRAPNTARRAALEKGYFFKGNATNLVEEVDLGKPKVLCEETDSHPFLGKLLVGPARWYCPTPCGRFAWNIQYTSSTRGKGWICIKIHGVADQI